MTMHSTPLNCLTKCKYSTWNLRQIQIKYYIQHGCLYNIHNHCTKIKLSVNSESKCSHYITSFRCTGTFIQVSEISINFPPISILIKIIIPTNWYLAPGFNCCMIYNNSTFILQIWIEISQRVLWDSIHVCKELVHL